MISNQPYFYKKAELFPGSAFIIGADTAARLVNVRSSTHDKTTYHFSLFPFWKNVLVWCQWFYATQIPNVWVAICSLFHLFSFLSAHFVLTFDHKQIVVLPSLKEFTCASKVDNWIFCCWYWMKFIHCSPSIMEEIIIECWRYFSNVKAQVPLFLLVAGWLKEFSRYKFNVMFSLPTFFLGVGRRKRERDHLILYTLLVVFWRYLMI